MSSGWSLYISVLTLGTLLAMAWLLYASGRTPPTPGESMPIKHTFDGIEEEDNPLPRWWRWLFVATLVFAVVYLLLYPGLGNWRGLWPATDGKAGWSSAAEWAQEQAQAQARYAPLYARYAALPLEALTADPQALATGARLFASQCASCHGADGRGAPGFPNLADDLWRWGGGSATIKASIGQGRFGLMPPWGTVLGEQGSRDAAAYVLTLNGRTPANNIANPTNGARLYAQFCVACHGPQARGSPLMGAPDLTKARGFIYGAGFEQVLASIRDGRQGQMPAQAPLLGDDRVHLLAAYVLSLSLPPTEPAPTPSDIGEPTP